MTIGIGTRLWHLDAWRRSRDPDACWTSDIITDETRTSWVLSRGTKVIKATMEMSKKDSGGFSIEIYRTDQQKADYEFCQAHKGKIAQAAHNCSSRAQLEAAAAALGVEIAA